MTTYEMAQRYYNTTPKLWDKKRIQKLYEMGKLTEEEYKSIIGK